MKKKDPQLSVALWLEIELPNNELRYINVSDIKTVNVVTEGHRYIINAVTADNTYQMGQFYTYDTAKEAARELLAKINANRVGIIQKD